VKGLRIRGLAVKQRESGDWGVEKKGFDNSGLRGTAGGQLLKAERIGGRKYISMCIYTNIVI
jgi:hypothetical protein